MKLYSINNKTYRKKEVACIVNDAVELLTMCLVQNIPLN